MTLYHLISYMPIIGEQSEPSVVRWMENFVLLDMPVCGIYMLVYVCVCVPYVYNPAVHGRFYGLYLKMEMIVLENKPWRSLD